MVKLVIKSRTFRTVARQPALTWRAVCTEIVVRGLKCYHPSMKTIRSPNTELAVCIMCPYDLDLWPIFPKIGSCDTEVAINVYAYSEVYRRFSFWNIRS